MMTEDRLRALYGDVSPRAAVKVIDHLDAHCRAFIAASPLLILATSDGERLDVSPKGDPAGFVEVEDARHLILPDRPGNNRLDGMLNLLKHPAVALIFLIPAVDETLRITGRAEISEDEALRKRCAIAGRLPKTVLRIEVEEVFIHCGKALMRGGVWSPDSWPEMRPVGTLYEIVRDHAEVEVPATDQPTIDDLYRKSLY